MKKEMGIKNGIVLLIGIFVLFIIISVSAVEQEVTVTLLNGTEIGNESSSPLCIFENSDINLAADVNFMDCEGNVCVSLWNNELNKSNYSVSNNIDSNYWVIINNQNLAGPSNFQYFQYFARDCYNYSYNGSVSNFYVNSKTSLIVDPINPDGENSWYISEPSFSLQNSDAINLFYRWDSMNNIAYNRIFGLENIPNAPPIESAGILELNYWSEVGCGEEGEQNETFYVDLTDPEVKNKSPDNNAIIYDIFIPEISFLISDIYQSNSGINESSIILKLDDVNITNKTEITNSSEINVFMNYTPDYNLSIGSHEIYVYVKDNSGREYEESWFFEIKETPSYDLTVYSPFSGINDSKRIILNMTTSEKVEKIEFINLDNKVPKWSKLCSDCNEYGYLKKRTKIINEGENNIIVRAINSNDLIKEKTFSIFVDSKTPKIKSIFPTRGFTNGIFNIEFSELNPENLTLYYGNEGHYLEKNVNLSKCYVEDDDKYFCQVNVNLSEFDSEEISYYFKLVDIGDNTKTSKVNDLDVDLTNPVINSLNYDIEGRYVYFTIGVDETYFDEVGYSYIDSKGKVKEKRLCTKLKNDEVCEKKTSFKDGTHNITIYAKDEVGQKDEKDISFLIDSKEPRIKKTIPTRGFTNGIFNIEFVEQNPVDLILYYGYKWNYSEKKVNLSECFIEEDEYFCEVSLNLSEFNSEEINYYFELIDIVERKDITKPRNLDVDTTSPVLNNPDWFWYQGEERNKRYIYFYFDVTEDNFDSIVYTYIDSRGREREKKICSRLKDGICTAKKSFSRGEHILDIKIKDKAGNSVSTESVEFVV